MQKQKFTHFIEKKEEGSYIKIPFEVPSDIDKLIIEYDYPRYVDHTTEGFFKKEEVSVIDFGLYSNRGFIGASGSNRQRIEISSHSDPGFANVNIESGEWYILVGAYKIEPSGVEVHYSITFIEKERTLYKGDTHTHTVSSDGSYTYGELLEKADKEGLDFLILSDHNNFTQNQEITGREKLTVIPGTEWTHYKGHANLIGSKQAIKDPFVVKDIADMHELLTEARENGAAVSVNHPFCAYCGWEWDLNNTSFDLIEIWNGGIMPDSNKQALEWWGKQLNLRRKIVATAGSDFHKVQGLRNLGQPVLGVWAFSNNSYDLLSSIKKGHTYLSYAIEAPSILLKAEDGIQGDTISSKKVSFTVENLKKGDLLYFITDQDSEIVTIENNVDQLIVNKEFSNVLYTRMEIYRKPFSDSLKMPISLSNPIYFK